MKSFLTHLECTYCGREHSAETAHRLCTECGKVLYARYDLEGAAAALRREDLAGRPANMWRYFEVMPVRSEANVLTLGEGFTPIFEADRLGGRLGFERLLIKDEGLNPTGSFKARGMSAAVSKAKELGITKITMPSAGNAAGATAAYAARGGISAHVFMPKDAPEAAQKESLQFGARLTLVDGLISDAGQLSRAMAEEHGLFDMSTLQEPYRAEGKKTMGYEIAEQMGWSLPDAIVYPTGGGTGIVGMWKAFAEMEAMGWIGPERPKMFCVQAEGCAPIVRAFEAGDRVCGAVAGSGDDRARNTRAGGHRRLPYPRRAAGKRRRRADGVGRGDPRVHGRSHGAGRGVHVSGGCCDGGRVAETAGQRGYRFG